MKLAVRNLIWICCYQNTRLVGVKNSDGCVDSSHSAGGARDRTQLLHLHHDNLQPLQPEKNKADQMLLQQRGNVSPRPKERPWPRQFNTVLQHHNTRHTESMEVSVLRVTENSVKWFSLAAYLYRKMLPTTTVSRWVKSGLNRTSVWLEAL